MLCNSKHQTKPIYCIRRKGHKGAVMKKGIEGYEYNN